MRVRLLISAARITAALVILGMTVLGEPDPGIWVAMQSVAWSWPRVAILGNWPMRAPAPAVPMPTEVCTPTATLPPTHVPADGPPTWIEAPSIQLDAPVVEVGYTLTYLGGTEAMEWEVPANAAGFHRGSAYPGHPGNTVISGHHNIAGEVFRYLIDLSLGDRITLYVDKTPYNYRVTQKELVQELGVSDEVRRANAHWISPTDDERLTLVTCWPYSGNSHRLIIVAMPTP